MPAASQCALCVHLGVIIGENRERRARWRRENSGVVGGAASHMRPGATMSVGSAVALGMVGVAVANFVIFLALAQHFGGDAMNGQVVDGHYFLGQHGKLTEVSEGIYTYSLWHVRSLFVSHPLGMFCAWLAWRLRSREE